MDSTVYSVATLAQRWECGPDTVYSLIRSGELPRQRSERADMVMRVYSA